MNSVVREFAGDKITLLVVWEPILWTDTRPPSNRELARVPDPRAAQFWDKDARVSRAIGAPIVARGQDEKRQRYRTNRETLWDTVAVYPAGVRWDEGGPVPAYTGGPVLNVASDLQQVLRQALARGVLQVGTGN